MRIVAIKEQEEVLIYEVEAWSTASHPSSGNSRMSTSFY